MTELHSPPDELHLVERKKTGESDDLIMDERDGARHGRVYKKSNWTLIELQVLQTAKREDQDKQNKADSKEKHKSAAERWQWIEDYCWMHGVERSAQQCRDRWERMSADFKKVGDYEKNVPKCGVSYWQMTIEERKVKKLPTNFQQEVFNLLAEWFVRSRAVDTNDNVIDTSAPSPLDGRWSKFTFADFILGVQMMEVERGVFLPFLITSKSSLSQRRSGLRLRRMCRLSLREIRECLRVFTDYHVSAVISMNANLPSGENSADEGYSAPQDIARKKRNFFPGLCCETAAGVVERASVATQKTMLECEDRKDRRHKEMMEANERIANGYVSALLNIADALRGSREGRF